MLCVRTIRVLRAAKLKGASYSKAGRIVRYAGESVGLTDGTEAGKRAVRWFAEKIMEITRPMKEVEDMLHEKCMEIPCAENILEMPGIGERILSGILAEMGDIDRFDDVREIQKLSGMGLVACSSGKHKGETKISRRGRKKLRYWLFQAAKSAVSHSAEFKTLHMYYTTRADNPLKKMQPLIVIACKILRVFYAILKHGTEYDLEKKPVHDGVAATASTPEVCQRLKMAQHPLTESVPLKIRQGW